MIRRVLLHPVTEVVVAVLLASVLLAAIKSGQAPLAVAVGVFLAAQLVNVWATLRWLARVEPGYELLLRRLRMPRRNRPQPMLTVTCSRRGRVSSPVRAPRSRPCRGWSVRRSAGRIWRRSRPHRRRRRPTMMT